METKKIQKNKGFVILFAIVMVSIILSVTFGVSNIALKELNFSTSAKETNDAFYAADIGAECAFMNDKFTSNSFLETGGSGFVNCLGSLVPLTQSGVSPLVSWGFTLTGLGANSQNCAKVTVTKNSNTNPITTNIDSKGYNMGDSNCNLNTNRVERNILATYGGDPNAASLVASPSTVTAGGLVTVTFNNIPTPTAQDYIGRYLVSSSNLSGAQASVYTNSCTSTPGVTTRSFGSCVFAMPSTPESYNFRAFANGNINNLIVTSNAVTVSNPVSSFALNVVNAGTGSGVVTSNVGAINCGTTCTDNYSSGSNVNLTATPNPGSTFTGWAGDCSGTGVCGVTMSSNINVTAHFTIIPQITFVGANSASGTSVTIPAHQAGDLIIMFAYRDGNTTPPSLTTDSTNTWTSINFGGGSTNSSRLAYTIATNSSTTSGSWPLSTEMAVQVFRGQKATNPIGDNRTGSGASNTVTYPVLPALNTSGTSWVVGFAGHRNLDTSLETPPTGMLNRTNHLGALAEVAGHSTPSGVSSWAATNVTVGGVQASPGWHSRTVEILAP